MKHLKQSLSLFLCFQINAAAPIYESIHLNNVESSLPKKYQERFERYLKSSIDQDGPNCFHATAYITGLTNRITYMSDQEFVGLLKKFNCQKIEKHEALKSGDIGLLSSDFSKINGMKNYEHAFIWDRYPDYLIEKIGSYSSFKLKQSHINESSEWTLFKKECLSNPDKCSLKLTNYRCPQYLAEKPYQGSDQLKALSQTVENWLRSTDTPSEEKMTQMELELKNIVSHSTSEIKEEALSLLRQVKILQDPN